MSDNIAATTVTISDGSGRSVTLYGGLSGVGWQSSQVIEGGWTRMKPRTPHEAQWLQRIRGLPPLRVVRSRRGRR